MTTTPTPPPPDHAEEPSRFVCVTGQTARLREADSVAMERAWTIREHDENWFAITPYTRPSWLDTGSMIDIEIRHPDGREYFTSTVAEIVVDDNSTTWVWFHQPPRTEHVDLRRSPRADLSAEVTWALLDDDQRPGPDREAELTNLSASGLRMRLLDRPLPSRHDLIVCSLHLTVARVNLLGTIVGVDQDEVSTFGDARVAFRDVDDDTQHLLGAEVSRHLDEPVDVQHRVLISHSSREHMVAMARATYGEVGKWQ